MMGNFRKLISRSHENLLSSVTTKWGWERGGEGEEKKDTLRVQVAGEARQ